MSTPIINKLLSMNKLKLPDDIINEIKYNLFLTFKESHQRKIRSVLDDIITNTVYCDTCGKFLVKGWWSSRKGEEICCSLECVDNYPGLYYCYTFLNKSHL